MSALATVAPRRRLRASRVLVVALVVVASLVLVTTRGSAHPSFGAAAGFGFAPNTAGGTGATGSTPPYAPGTVQALSARVPYEQGATTYTGTGGFNTTTRVDIVVPSGWTNPACSGAPRRNVNDSSTGSTNQPGADVADWSCSVVSENGHAVVRWTGPQLAASVPVTESAQWFVFSVRTPSPTVQTTYDGRVDSGTEGYIIDQWYASSVDPSTGCSPSPCAGSVRHWYPNANYPGIVPPGADLAPGDLAGGLVRTVAGTSGAVSITTDAGSISGSTAVAYSPVLASTNPPAGVTFPYGRVSFTVTGLTPGQTVQATLTYPGPVTEYWKFQNSSWSKFAGAAFSGNTVVLTLADGGSGDGDGLVNGIVVDPGAPAVASAGTPTAVAPVPVGPLTVRFTG